jgi:hypothetical protein
VRFRYDSRVFEVVHDDEVQALVATVNADNCEPIQAHKDGVLLACAPDLLEALKRLTRDMETPRTRRATEAWDAARAAIAKAEGQ